MNIDINSLHEPVTPEPRFRIIKIMFKVIGAIFIIFVLIGAPVVAAGWRMVKEAQIGRSALITAANSASRLNFSDAAAELRTARAHLADANKYGLALAPFSVLPYFGDDIRGARTLVKSSLATATALERIATLGDDLLGTLSNAGGLNASAPTLSGGVVAFFRLSPENRRAVLKDLSHAPSDLSASVDEIDEALAGFDSLPDSGYLTPIVSSLKPVIAELRGLRDQLAAAAELSKILPALSGYPTPKTYLLLLENNTEMRTTGGFIGTLGVITIVDAQAENFKAMDVYAIDGAAGEKLKTVPPEPLKKYLAVNKWYLRDANWSPDFPTSANKVVSIYAQEGGKEIFDGVLSVDPTVAEDLLKIVGNITIGTSTFTPDNVTDEIEYQVEKGFDAKGLPVAQRKDILVALADEVFKRVLALPGDRWQLVVDTLVKALDQKHMLIASFDPAVEEFARGRNWDGAMRQTPGDFLMVVDANLAALKTDSVMTRSIDYSIQPDGTGYKATVTLKYENNGRFSWKTTRYRTYTRIFVPLGSKLISSTGAMLNDKILDPKRTPGAVDTLDERGRRSFGAFLSVEPGETRTLTFTYRLPLSIATGITLNNYELLVQKQPGTVSIPLTLDLDFGKRVTSATPVEEQKNWGDGSYNVTTDLVIDREFTVGF